MDPLEFQQDTIKWCSFHIAASAGSLADADDVEQIIREKLLTVDEDDEEFFPDDCRDKKAWAFRWAQFRARRELEYPRWKNSTRGKVPHTPIGGEARNLKTQTRDETCVSDAKTIRDLLSAEEWKLIRMRYYEGMSFPKIGERFDLTSQAIYYRHKVIMAKIQAGLEIV